MTTRDNFNEPIDTASGTAVTTVTTAKSDIKTGVSDETRRLARLRMLAILDTEPEPIFESLARLASTICGTPIALVSLLDGKRQWVKANVGLPGFQETDQRLAFCGHALQSDSLMEVSDAQADPRFAANPFVTDAPNIRFYAGMPLVMPGGERVGTLCVIDHEVRRLSSAQRQMLHELAQAVTEALLLREKSYYPEITGDEDRFRVISEASPQGIFQADLKGACIYTNPRWCEIYRLAPGQSLGHAWRERVHPEDRQALISTLKVLAKSHEAMDIEHRLLHPDGQVTHVHVKARLITWGNPPQRGVVGTLEDVTHRKQVEDQLRASNKFLDRAERIAGVGGYAIDLRTRKIDWTAQMWRIYDIDPDMQPTHAEPLNCFDAAGQELIAQTTAHAIRTGQPWDMELPMVTVKGRATWVRSVGVVEHENSLPVRLVGTLQDISATKAAEQALRQSQERQHRALTASRLVLWDADVQNSTVYLSDTWSDLMEGPGGPVVMSMQTLFAQVPEEDLSLIENAIRSIAQGLTETYAVEHRIRTYSGVLVWIRSEGQVTQRDAAGKVIGATGVSRDITERKLAEARLRHSAAITTATLEATADGILVVNDQRQIVQCNQHFLDMLGIVDDMDKVSLDTVKKILLQQVVNPDQLIVTTEALYASAQPETQEVIEFKNGRVLERYSKLHVLDGRAIGRVWSYRDVTTKRAAELELKNAKAAAEAASLAKTSFLATMSHEIRTPLNGILGITQLLLDEPLNPQQAQFAQLIDANAQSLQVMVNDFLDLTKIDSGLTLLENEPFDLLALLADMAALYGYRANAKGLVFRQVAAPDVPRWIWGDATRMRQVLNNLLANALKFTAAGEFSLTVSSLQQSDGNTTLQFRVADTGIGIAADVQPRLFNRFVQADVSTTRQYGGTGLGLAIVKQLSELMGGHVELVSATGKGSTFTLVLPDVREATQIPTLPDLTPDPTRTSAYPGERTEKILLVEDNPTNQIVAVGLLKKIGYSRVTLAHNGLQAVTSALDADFALVLMDCQMPLMDGYAATRLLRAKGYTTPIIAMTANAMSGDAAKCLEAGMDDYLSKPVKQALLAASLSRWLGHGPQQPAASTPGVGQAVSKDDDNALSVFDSGSVMDRLGNDQPLISAVIASFTQRAPEILQELDAALLAQDAERAARHLHSLLGSSASVSANSVNALVSRMGQWLKAGDMAHVQQALPQLARRLEDFARATAAAGF